MQMQEARELAADLRRSEALLAGADQTLYVAKRSGRNDITAILRPIHRGMLQFLGFDVLEPQIFYGPVHLTDEQRKQLKAIRGHL
jgi:putative NADPH-quinone reductase